MVELSPDQERAVKTVTDRLHNAEGGEVVQLLGYAGTGKSTVLPHIIDSLGFAPDDCAFVAPTGKAAKVASKKLKEGGINTDATTIHKAIYRPKPLKAEALQKEVEATRLSINHMMGDGVPHEIIEAAQLKLKQLEHDLDKAYDESDTPSFQLNPDSNIAARKLIVVDEASMVGAKVAEDLRLFGVPILAVGDPGQLPPVGDDPGLLVGKPEAVLETIHRQAADNPIIALSQHVRDGKRLKPGRWGETVEILSRGQDDVTTGDIDAQVICGKNDTRWKLTKRIRKAFDFTTTGPDVDEPLIVCRNSRKIPELVNGTFVCSQSSIKLHDGDAYFRIEVIDEAGVPRAFYAWQGLFEENNSRQKGAYTSSKYDMYRARKECEHLDWGWVITCHKSQGSQWDNVIVHDEGQVFREDAVRWRYTALTRAAQNLWVIV